MLPFVIRRFNARSGEDVVVLARRSGGIFFYPNVFVTADYRNTGKSPNTIARVLRTLGMAIMWAETKARDLDQDLATGQFFSVLDANDLASFLKLTAAEQEAAHTNASAALSHHRRPSIIGLEAFRPHPRDLSRPEPDAVSAEDAGARIRWVAKYADWHLRRRLHSMEVDRLETEPFKSNAEAAIETLRKKAPPVSGFIDDDKALESPDFEVIKRIEEILLPNSLENPFTSGFIQARNYFIWRLLVDSGGRRHEIHAAKSADIVFSLRRFEIKTSKTIPRTVAIRPNTATAFDNYFMSYWKELPEHSHARKTGYLICDKNGRRLSMRAINRIFETVRKILEEQPQNITPHAMRRFWNYHFSTMVDQTPAERRISPEEEANIRKRIMGWSTDVQAKRYNKRHIREAGDKISQQMLDALDRSSNDQPGS